MVRMSFAEFIAAIMGGSAFADDEARASRRNHKELFTDSL
jgi:hypothetical protein